MDMNLQQIEEFQKRYRKIADLKGELTSNAAYLRKLQFYDKNDSHKTAILKALNIRDGIKKKMEALMDGKTYDQWKTKAAQVLKLKTQLKRKTNEAKA